jgi:cytochrome P450
MFPLIGTISQVLPRILLTLYNYPEILDKVRNNNISIRHCILESLRLNSPVITLLRENLNDIEIDGKFYVRGSQFLILPNSLMRDPRYFQSPNKYIPVRWKNIDESEYTVLMFGQGPQKCPGKEMAINLIIKYLEKYIKINYTASPAINKYYFPQTINPFKILIDF